MRRLPLIAFAILLVACTDNPVAPSRTLRVDASGGRHQITNVTWEKSTTGVDIVPIGLYNNQYTILVDINENGLAVGWGYANTPEGQRERAISWQNGVFTDLGTLGGNFSRAHQVNNAGVIVGESQDAAGRYRAVVWENGIIRELPPLNVFQYSDANAQSINEHGDIVGEDRNDNGVIHAALWPASGGAVDLGQLPGSDFSRARGINRNGAVFGQSASFSNFIGRPMIWSGGTLSEIIMPPGGRANGNIATGKIFNNAGEFVAEVAPDAFNFGQAIVYRNGAFETLPMLPNAFQQFSQAFGLNEAGDIVGEAYGPSNFNPVLWSHDGTLTDLGQPQGMGAGDAHGINNSGLIVGQAHGEWSPGIFNSGAVLWRVTAADVTPPTITYSSHPSDYAVDEHVSITCTASDTQSGIASDTCAPIDGDAYTFGLGAHIFSATATDNAGNTVSASTSFNVIVTFGSLANLTVRLVTNKGVATYLVKDLTDAQDALANGKPKLTQSKLNDYRQVLRAQAGKSITAANASVLTTLSLGL